MRPSTAKRWRRICREGGDDTLAAKPHPGGRRKLSEAQLDESLECVIAFPLAADFPTDLWTCDRAARLARLYARLESRLAVAPLGCSQEGVPKWEIYREQVPAIVAECRNLTLQELEGRIAD